MKTCIYLSLVLFLCSFCFGAHFTPVQEMTYCNSDALSRILPIYDPNELIDRQDEWNPNFNGSVSDTSFNPAPTGGYVTAYAETHIEYYIDTQGSQFTDNMLYMFSFSSTSVAVDSDDGVEAYAWGGATVVEPGTAVGNFYRIDPDAGESNGDTVTLSFEFLADLLESSSGGSSNSVSVSGDFAGDNVMISRNCTDFSNVSSGEILHSIPKIDIAGNYQDGATLTAQVGDVIGIHCGVYSNAYTGTNPGSADSEVTVDLSLEITDVTAQEYTAADADIDGSGRVDLGDLAIIAMFWLQDASSTGTNDGSTCAKAITIGDFGTVPGDNFGALISPVTTCGGGDDGNAVWYKFTSPEDMFVRFTVIPNFDATVAIYSDCVGGQLECDDDYPNDEIFYGTDPGETVYIRIGGWFQDEGTFELEVQPAFPG